MGMAPTFGREWAWEVTWRLRYRGAQIENGEGEVRLFLLCACATTLDKLSLRSDRRYVAFEECVLISSSDEDNVLQKDPN